MKFRYTSIDSHLHGSMVDCLLKPFSKVVRRSRSIRDNDMRVFEWEFYLRLFIMIYIWEHWETWESWDTWENSETPMRNLTRLRILTHIWDWWLYERFDDTLDERFYENYEINMRIMKLQLEFWHD